MELPKRKTTRLSNYDYNTPGYYFITICTKEKQKLLCHIVGTGLPDGPKVRFTQQGEIVRNQLQDMKNFYDDIRIDKHVIMPNHIHLLLHVFESDSRPSGRPMSLS